MPQLRRREGRIPDGEGRVADGRLVERVRAGEVDAYAELVRRHGGIALRTAALLGAGTDAEDVCQEAWVKAYRALGRFRTDEPFRPWLLRIVANEARNHHRATVRRGDRERRAYLPEPSDPEAEVLDRARRERLATAVAALPDRLRATVTCRYLLDLDEAESAQVLGIPRGTVKSRLSRGLRRLRADLAEQPIEEGDHV